MVVLVSAVEGSFDVNQESSVQLNRNENVGAASACLHGASERLDWVVLRRIATAGFFH